MADSADDTLDYLAIGHVTRDWVGEMFTIGGTVSYAARTAQAMDCRVGVVTSADPELDISSALGGALVARWPAATTTTFENIYTPGGRRQRLRGVAGRLTPEMIPPCWQTKIIHLAPVADECDPRLAWARPGAFLGLTPQGWLRRWGQDGCVHRGEWEMAEELLAQADAVVLSEEDVAGDRALITRYASQTRVLVITQGAEGCTVYAAGQRRHLPAPPAREVDATGAGDIFAAVLFVRLQRSGDPWTAARLANCVAARSVQRVGLDSVPTADEIAACEQSL